MNTLSLITLIYTLSLGIPPMALASSGGWNGGADSAHFDDHAAWYLNAPGEKKTIKACVVIANSEHFGLDAHTIHDSIDSSIQRWNDYLERKQFGLRLKGQASFAGVGRISRKSTQGTHYSTCDGYEDLRFEFGTTSTKIEDAKKRYRLPYAFSLKGEKIGNLSWHSNSIIWVSPEIFGMNKKNKKLKLEMILTHEIGHMLGNEHIDGTIMAENIIESLPLIDDAEAEASKESLKEIDQRLVLLPDLSINKFNAYFFSGQFFDSQLDPDTSNIDRSKKFYKNINAILFGLNVPLAEYFPATQGSISFDYSFKTGTYELSMHWKNGIDHVLALGKPTDIFEGNLKKSVFQRVVSYQEKRVESFSHVSRTFVFKKTALEQNFPIYISLNEENQFALQFGDPILGAQYKWISILASNH